MVFPPSLSLGNAAAATLPLWHGSLPFVPRCCNISSGLKKFRSELAFLFLIRSLCATFRPKVAGIRAEDKPASAGVGPEKDWLKSLL